MNHPSHFLRPVLRVVLCGIAAWYVSSQLRSPGYLDGPFRILYGIGVPVLGFLVLAVLSTWRRHGELWLGAAGFAGGLTGVTLGNLLPCLLAVIDARNSRGGGANIGLGLLIVATPVLVVAFGSAGMAAGTLATRLLRKGSRT